MHPFCFVMQVLFPEVGKQKAFSFVPFLLQSTYVGQVSQMHKLRNSSLFQLLFVFFSFTIVFTFNLWYNRISSLYLFVLLLILSQSSYFLQEVLSLLCNNQLGQSFCLCTSSCIPMISHTCY